MSERILQVEGLVTAFPMGRERLPVVDGVGVEISEGETLSLVGESGCGNSMTALSILRLVADPPGRIAGLPAIGALGFYLLFGPWLLEFVYHDPVYRAGFPVLALLSLARLVTVFTGSAAVTLSMTGHQDALLRITVTTSILTVVATFLVVGRWGSTGVAAAISGGVALQALAVWLTARIRTGIWTHVTVPTVGEIRALFRRET